MSQGFNLIGNNEGCFGFVNNVNGDLVGTQENPISPVLLPLAFNGGPTETNAILMDSPAFDAGNQAPPDGVPPRCETTDQRGVMRPQSTFCDIGAFELQVAEINAEKSAACDPDP